MAGAYDRILAPFRALKQAAFPRDDYKGGFQYSVTSCDYAGQTADLDPVSPAVGDLVMPSLVAIPIRSPLLMVKLVPGEVVVVSFENFDPAYPYVSGLPSAGGGAPVARQGDVVWVQAALVPAPTWPGGVIGPAIPNVYNLVVDPTALGPPPVPPIVPATASGKLFGIAASGSQFVKSK